MTGSVIISKSISERTRRKQIRTDMAKAADFCPAIYYMDPDDEYGMLDEVANQTRNGNIVTAHIDKMGYYILCNKTDLDEFWNRPFEW